MFWIQQEAHHFYISGRFGSTAYAIYAVGCFQVPLLGLMRESIVSVLSPRTTLYQQQGRMDDIIDITARAMRKLSLVYWPVSLFLLVWATEFMELLYTAKYRSSVPIFRIGILMIATLIPLTDPMFLAFVQHRFFIVRVRLVLIAVLAGSLQAGVDWLGMRGGLAVAVAVTVLERIIMCWKAARILEMKASELRRFWGVVNTGIAAAAALIPALLIDRVLTGCAHAVILIGCGTVYGLAYITVLFLCGFVEADERASVCTAFDLGLGRGRATTLSTSDHTSVSASHHTSA